MPIYTISRRPDEISDLIHWFDAGDISTINSGSSDPNLPGTVLKLKDKVSNMALFSDTHGDPPRLITSSALNGNTGIYFSGHPGACGLSGFFTDSSFNTKKTIFFVFFTKLDIPDYCCYKFSILNPGNRLLAGLFGGWPNISLSTKDRELNYLETTEFTTLPTIEFGSISASEVHIVSISTDDIVKSTLIDGVSKYLYNDPNNIPLKGSKLILGDVTDVSYTPNLTTKPFANVEENIFCEMLIYDRALIEEEVNKVNQYLKTKWIG
jgi:hypothetical protein